MAKGEDVPGQILYKSPIGWIRPTLAQVLSINTGASSDLKTCLTWLQGDVNQRGSGPAPGYIMLPDNWLNFQAQQMTKLVFLIYVGTEDQKQRLSSLGQRIGDARIEPELDYRHAGILGNGSPD